MSVLDNAVWHSLTTAHQALAQRQGGAARFDPAVSVFAAIEDEPTASTWDDLDRLVGPGGSAILSRSLVEPPSNWTVDWSLAGVQMMATAVRGVPAEGAVELTTADLPEMMGLVEATKPGPFERRTIELGRYVGIRRDGELVAMAGERLRPDGFCEVSAVCTAEQWRGQGLAEALVRDVVANVEAAGRIAMLHVAETNSSAIKLYERLGFTTHQTVTIVEVRRHPT